MSKFCPMCNEVTNCTDNCNSCVKEADDIALHDGDIVTASFDLSFAEHTFRVSIENNQTFLVDRDGNKYESNKFWVIKKRNVRN